MRKVFICISFFKILMIYAQTTNKKIIKLKFLSNNFEIF